MFGLTLTLTVSNSVFLNTATTKIAAVLPDLPRGEVQVALAGEVAQLFRGLTPEERLSSLQAVMQSLSHICIIVIVVGMLSLLCPCFVKWENVFVQPKSDESRN